jgi:multiple sugar transport system ATP-binding protein
MSALAIRDVHKKFGATEVLKGISLEIGKGEFTVLVGPSGCGKSTLLNLLGGIDRPSAGSVLINGSRIDAMRDAEATRFR